MAVVSEEAGSLSFGRRAESDAILAELRGFPMTGFRTLAEYARIAARAAEF